MLGEVARVLDALSTRQRPSRDAGNRFEMQHNAEKSSVKQPKGQDLGRFPYIFATLRPEPVWSAVQKPGNCRALPAAASI